MANIEGDFSISIPCGQYEVAFQSLGYKTIKKTLQISADNEDLNITMQQAVYQLATVNIDPNAEDPAYNIIRKATVMSELYKKQITAYTTNLYIRQFYNIDDIPWLARKAIPEDELKEIETGNIKETLLEYRFERPNKVKERIIAKRTGDKDTSKTGSNYINLSFYNLGGPGIINPLSRGAFQVYKFEHIHSYYEGSQKIHKIKLIPRREGNDLMKGYIYINDEIWNLNKVNVTYKQTGGTISYIQFYNKVKEFVWMPVNHKIKVDFGLLGFKGEVQYLATLSDLQVSTDTIIDQKIKNSTKSYTAAPSKEDSSIVKSQVNKGEKNKTQGKIEELIQKKKLSNRETYKLVRLLKKQAAEERKKDSVRSLEVKRDYTLEYEDSALVENDSLWKKERDVPLSEKERLIYVGRDSLNKVENGDTVINEERGFFGNLLFYDGGIQSENKRRTFNPKGILSGLSGYFNTVDGFTINKSILTYSWNNKKGKFYSIEPQLGYTFSREKVIGLLDFKAQYNMKKRAGFNFSAGRKTSDFNTQQAMHPLLNTFASLIFTENFPKFYQRDFVEIEHHIDIKNGLVLSSTFSYNDRKALVNNSSYALFDSESREYTSNNPDNPLLLTNPGLITDHQSAILDISLSYTPRQFYTYHKNKKVVLRSKYPTFNLDYRQGINDLLGSDADFSALSFSVQQSFSYRLINRINYHVEVGKFLTNDQVFFADFKNFNTSPFYLKNNNAINAFNLLDYYSFNTNNEYLEAHLSIEDNHILLKRLPLLNASNLTEKVYFNYLLIDDRSANYYELGYSLNRIFLFMNLGIYASFEDDEFDQFGFRLGLDIFN